MDDLDDLDNILFNKKLNSKETTNSAIDETKKKVMFKDFEENDPLEDLNFSDDDDFQKSLAEESKESLIKDAEIEKLFGFKLDNQSEIKDSVEDSDAIKTSKIDDPTIKESPVLPVKSLIEKSKETKSISKEPNFPKPLANSPVASKPENPAPITTNNNTVTTTSKMKSIFDDDDISSNLLDKPKAMSATITQSKKSSLMEDLFGSKPKSSPSVDTDRKKNSFSIDVPATRSNTGESSTGPLIENTSKTLSTGFSLSMSKEPRRGRRSSTVQNDPLGLLSSSLQIEETPKPQVKIPDPEIAPKSTAIDDLPEWLGGPKVSKEQKQEIEKTRSDVSSSANTAKTSVLSTEILDKTAGSADLPVIGGENINQSNLTSKLLSMEFDQQAAIINMQQQEHELRTAAQLSQQSEKLNDVLETQKVKLTEQEKQFNMLISRQLERQALLEAQMKAQQDRINNYIQTLTAQPTTIPSIHFAVNKDSKIDSKESVDEKIELESLLQKVQLEKLYLENTLDSLREKHEKEISILEDSYKKQVQFLEEAMVQMEKRMQDDVECLEADYKAKIQKLRDEMAENEKIHKLEKETLKQENSQFIDDIRRQQNKNLEILQKEHIEIIERITKSKESERQAIEIMRADGTNVQNILNKTQVIFENLEDLQKKFESRNNNFIESQDNHLTVQQKNIEYLKELLEKQKNEFIEEKQKLMSIVQKLESDNIELMQEFRKQNIIFKESQEVLQSREQALLRDREIFIEQTNWERERLQAMREAWAKEEDRQLQWLAQERQALAAEKGRLQIFNRLKIGEDESSKIELEATIRAAQDAAASANQERLKWQEKVNELEMQQRSLQEKENHLIEKAKALEEFTKSTLAKRDEGLKALKEAHFLEERYKEKFSQLQKQQEILTEKESKLASGKLELARERLSFRVSQAEKPEEDIFRKIEKPEEDIFRRIEKPEEDIFRRIDTRLEDQSIHSDIPSITHHTTYSKDIVNPNVVLLKWGLGSKMDVSKSFALTTSH